MSAARAGSDSAECTLSGKGLKRERKGAGAENSPGDEAAAMLSWAGMVVVHDGNV